MNERTFELLRNRLHGDEAAGLQPLTAAQAEELRSLVVEAHEHYQRTGGEGTPERHEDVLVDGLRHVAEDRMGSGNMPFAVALDQVLAEVQEVGS